MDADRKKIAPIARAMLLVGLPVGTLLAWGAVWGERRDLGESRRTLKEIDAESGDIEGSLDALERRPRTSPTPPHPDSGGPPQQSAGGVEGGMGDFYELSRRILDRVQACEEGVRQTRISLSLDDQRVLGLSSTMDTRKALGPRFPNLRSLRDRVLDQKLSDAERAQAGLDIFSYAPPAVTPDVVAALAGVLQRSPDAQVRREVAAVIANSPSPEMVPLLMERLSLDPNEEVRDCMLVALGWFRDDHAVVEAIENASAHDLSDRVRRRAKELLGH